MSTEVTQHVRRWRWRGALLLLVLLPFLPEAAVLLTRLLARANGCDLGGQSACAFGPIAAEIIRVALQAAWLIGMALASGFAVVWLALSYLAIARGWAHVGVQLLVALIVSVIAAFFPYFGPILSTESLLNPGCRSLNEGRIPPSCKIYGAEIGETAFAVGDLGWKFFIGASIAFIAFVIFAIVVIRTRPRSASQS